MHAAGPGPLPGPGHHPAGPDLMQAQEGYGGASEYPPDHPDPYQQPHQAPPSYAPHLAGVSHSHFFHTSSTKTWCSLSVKHCCLACSMTVLKSSSDWGQCCSPVFFILGFSERTVSSKSSTSWMRRCILFKGEVCALFPRKGLCPYYNTHLTPCDGNATSF